MKTKPQKNQFQCEVCKNWFKIKKINFNNQLCDTRKYINKKIVCDRCFYRLKNKNKGVKENMVGLH